MAFIFGVCTTIIVGGGLGYVISNLTDNILAGILSGIIILLIPPTIAGIMFGRQITKV